MSSPPTTCGHLTCLCAENPLYLKNITKNGESVWVCPKPRDEQCNIFLRESKHTCWCLDANDTPYTAREYVRTEPNENGWKGTRWVCQMPGKDKCGFKVFLKDLPPLKFNKTRTIKRLQ